MYLFSALALFTFLVSFPAQAARILAEDSNGKKISIALDAAGKLRMGENYKGSSPTIKDFREDGAVTKYCFEGSAIEASQLLGALVNSASLGLKAITENKRGDLVVVADVNDESGKREENYLINACR